MNLSYLHYLHDYDLRDLGIIIRGGGKGGRGRGVREVGLGAVREVKQVWELGVVKLEDLVPGGGKM